MTKYQGQCFCGEITFEIADEPIMMVNCHCLDCQKWTGCAYESSMLFAEDTFKLNGNVKFYESVSDAGNTVSRGFCPQCGGAVLNKSSGFDNIVIIYAGVVNEPKNFNPTAEIFTSSAQNWSCMLDNTQKFDKGPTN